jgi:hypothetical protein
MATCPDCYGYLHEKHRCRTRSGRTWRQWAMVALISIAGGYGITVALSGGPSPAMMTIGVALAAGLVDAIAREAFSI